MQVVLLKSRRIYLGASVYTITGSSQVPMSVVQGAIVWGGGIEFPKFHAAAQCATSLGWRVALQALIPYVISGVPSLACPDEGLSPAHIRDKQSP